MPKRVLAAWLFLLCMCVSVPSFAQWEIAGYLGGAHTQNSNLILNQPSLGTNLRLGEISYRGESFQSPLYYGVRGGYCFRPHWGAEIEFTHLKVFANVSQPAAISGTVNGAAVNTRQPVDTIVQRFSISHGVNLLLANVVVRQQLWRPPSGLGRLLLAFRFGAGATIPHAETTMQGRADEHYQTGSPVIQLTGGVALKVWRKLYWMGEYKYTRVQEQVDVFSGTATSLLQSHHVVTGPVIHF